MSYDLRPISPSYPRVPWEERFPKEERGDMPATVMLVGGPAELMGRVLAQSDVNLTNVGDCMVVLINNRFSAREASTYLRDAQRFAIGLRCKGMA